MCIFRCLCMHMAISIIRPNPKMPPYPSARLRRFLRGFVNANPPTEHKSQSFTSHRSAHGAPHVRMPFVEWTHEWMCVSLCMSLSLSLAMRSVLSFDSSIRRIACFFVFCMRQNYFLISQLVTARKEIVHESNARLHLSRMDHQQATIHHAPCVVVCRFALLFRASQKNTKKVMNNKFATSTK